VAARRTSKATIGFYTHEAVERLLLRPDAGNARVEGRLSKMEQSMQQQQEREAYVQNISYTEKYRDLQQKYRDVQEKYRTRDFELECSRSAPVRSCVHRIGTYPTLKTFPCFFNYRSFEGVEAPEGCENVA
jgi:hypothetical protein